MLHFIPAWYQNNTWHENEQKWFVRRTHTEFDDTVKQIQLFYRNGVYPFQILLLSYSPNFRHFLHRQGVFHAPYWSCFDAIQEVKRRKAVPLSFHNMKWPAHVEFVYTPFVVTALLKGEKYAQIEFGEDGNPIEIDMYKDEIICRRNIYDDRGFVSSTIIYRDGQPFYQDYLMENGIWKLRCFQDDGHVEVNPGCPDYRLVYQEHEETRTFASFNYDSMERAVREVLLSYLELTEDVDLFCVAMHERHTDLLMEALKDKKVLLSFFGGRCDLENHPQAVAMTTMARYVVTDSKEQSERIRARAGEAFRKVTDISPYDTRVDFGISQQLSVQKILVPVDDLEDDMLRELVAVVGKYITQNEKAEIHLFTRQAQWDRPARLLELVRECLRTEGLTEEWGDEETSADISENGLDRDAAVETRFFVEQCVDELSVSKCMREQRILVDMRETPALYLQIMAISVGIPQIVRRKTQFINEGKNGRILEDLSQLSEALTYYLDGMANWNDAKVHAFDLGKEYASEVLINKWKEVIDFVG